MMGLASLRAGRRNLSDLSEREILALAISSEEEDGRIYAAYADGLKTDFPSSAAVFEDMAEEETGHRDRLIARYRAKFGDVVPPLRREDIKGFAPRKPYWLVSPLGIETVREQAALMEEQASRFYAQAAERSLDLSTKQLLLDLAREEKGHQSLAERLGAANVPESAAAEEARTARRLLVLQYIHPGLAGLIDGSVSTLAPVFAAAFATQNSWDAFLVGMAASIGAGISMGLTEAVSDDGSLTGRGNPWIRGLICGLMTMIGGLGHTLPYLIRDFWTATVVAVVIVVVELIAISWIRWKFMDTPFLKATFQVVVGGFLVFLTGILIGGAG